MIKIYGMIKIFDMINKLILIAITNDRKLIFLFDRLRNV